MTVYTGTHKGFLCFGHRYGAYAVRDGEEPGKPAGPRYAHLETDEDGDITAKIDDFLYFEAMDEADLIDEANAERGYGRPGLASAELDRRERKQVA